MTAPLPWMKFSPDRWQRDEALRMCGAAARGVWAELICIMHKADPYGHLLVRGKQPTDKQLSVITGLSMIELAQGLDELEANEVFSRTDDGTVFSRGMVRDFEKHTTASNNGHKGALAKARKLKAEKGTLRVGSRGGSRDPSNLEEEKEKEEEKNPPVVPQGTKHRIPDDWGPDEFGAGTQSRRVVDAWTPERYASELEGFRAHHRTAQSRYSDWQATWSTWVLNTEKFERRGTAKTTAAPRDHADIVLEEFEDRKRREQRQTQSQPQKKRAAATT